MTEPSKEDLELEGNAYKVLRMSETEDLVPPYRGLQTPNENWLEQKAKTISRWVSSLLAEVRAEGERKLAIEVAQTEDARSLAISLGSEKSALEERVRELESRNAISASEWYKFEKECTRLKAENERLRNKDFVAEAVKQVEASDSLYRQQCQIIKQKNDEIDRLTASLARAHHSLAWIKKLLPKDQAELDNLVENRLYELSHYLLIDFPEAIEHSLADKDGSLALERWRNLEQLVKDSCDDEEKIKVLAKQMLPAKWVDGDSHGVPGIVDLVELIAERWKRMEEVIEAVGIWFHYTGEDLGQAEQNLSSAYKHLEALDETPEARGEDK